MDELHSYFKLHHEEQQFQISMKYNFGLASS